jgi:hypothetical protein
VEAVTIPTAVTGMNWLEFTAAMVGHLAWPVAFVILILVFRKQIKTLIPKVSEMSIFGSSMAFAQGLHEAEQEAEVLPATMPEQKVDVEAPAVKGNYIELAQKYPEVAVLEAYKEVEMFLRDYRMKYGTQTTKHRPNAIVVRDILRNSSDGNRVLDLYEQLSRTRNIAVHDPGGSITASEAIAYKDLCKQLIQLLKTAVADNNSQP